MLSFAVQRGDAAKVRQLLAQGADPSLDDSSHRPLARETCQFDDARIMAILLEHGALRNASRPLALDEWPPAKWCWPSDASGCLSLMIEAGVDVGGRDPEVLLTLLQDAEAALIHAPKCAALLEAWLLRRGLPTMNSAADAPRL